MRVYVLAAEFSGAVAACRRLDMADTVTVSNLLIVQLHKGVGGQEFFIVCVHNAPSCGSVCIFICIGI